jgi:hypothetical protein
MASIFPRRAPAPPALFAEFCTGWLALSRTKTEQFWQALSASRWSRAATLKATVLGHEMLDVRVEQVTGLYQGLMAPQELVSVLEDLVKESRLSPLVARTIEEAVLRQTDSEGQWKGAA